MKRILCLFALFAFAGPILADDKAKIKELEDRLSKVEAAVSWKTTAEPKPTVELKATNCQCKVCSCDDCKCLTINGVPHVFANGSYHANGKISTAPPLTTSSPASSGVRVVSAGNGTPVHFMPQYQGSMIHFSQSGPSMGNCANGRCGR
jgi:hypothetical protein